MRMSRSDGSCFSGTFISAVSPAHRVWYLMNPSHLVLELVRADTAQTIEREALFDVHDHIASACRIAMDHRAAVESAVRRAWLVYRQDDRVHRLPAIWYVSALRPVGLAPCEEQRTKHGEAHHAHVYVGSNAASVIDASADFFAAFRSLS